MNSPASTQPTGSLGRRLGAGFAVTLVIALGGSGYGAWSLNRVARQTQQLVDSSVATDRVVSEWYRNVSVAVKRTTAIAVSDDPKLAEFFSKEAVASTQYSQSLQDKIEPMLTRDEEKRVLAQLPAIRKNYVDVRDRLSKLKKQGDAEGAAKLLDPYLAAADEYLGRLKTISELLRRDIDEGADAVQAANRDAQVALMAFGLIALLCGGAFSIWLTRGITQPIRRAVQAADRIAALDLTERIESHNRDETGRLLASLSGMQQSLRTLVVQVRSATDSIHTASSEISSGNVDLSSRTEEAASSLQQTAASIEQMNGTVQHSAANARTADQLATGAAEVAVRGGEVVERVVSTMKDINDSSKKIADITGVIDGIAFQTNILALNAAVEAARAGEQGRGFAVVASEVRSLAQRSAAAAKEIKTLIGDSVEKVDAGSQLVADAGQTMNEVVASVKRVSDIIGEITHAAQEQSQGIGEVNTAVAQLDQVTQSNAALVEQSAAAAESLKAQAQQLSQTVQRFRVSEEATTSWTPAPAHVEPRLAGAPALPVARASRPLAQPPVLKRPSPIAKAPAPAAPPAAPVKPTPAFAATVPAADNDGDWSTF
jgi:methyl-accepting chemotaxis protein